MPITSKLRAKPNTMYSLMKKSNLETFQPKRRKRPQVEEPKPEKQLKLQDLPRDKLVAKKMVENKKMISAKTSMEKESSTEARVTQNSDSPKSSLRSKLLTPNLRAKTSSSEEDFTKPEERERSFSSS